MWVMVRMWVAKAFEDEEKMREFLLWGLLVGRGVCDVDSIRIGLSCPGNCSAARMMTSSGVVGVYCE